MPPQPVDPWTAFLEWLQTILVPDWNGLINLLPVLIILGVLGPGLTFLSLYWMYHRFTDKRGNVKTDEPTPEPAARAADGTPIYPPNVPYCATHALIYPATYRECEIDREELLVRCPVDESVRVAGQQLCRTCGTRYQLGASLAPVVVRSHGRPPAGGAAIA
ncbi:MAG: hypothetical protein WD830_04570 [Chloroflexota bacterium]